MSGSRRRLDRWESTTRVGRFCAHALWRWVPLYDEPELEDLNRGRRLRLFCEAFGLNDRSRLLPTIRRQKATYLALRTWAAEGIPAFVRMWEEGHAEGPLRDMAFLDLHWNELDAALQ